MGGISLTHFVALWRRFCASRRRQRHTSRLIPARTGAVLGLLFGFGAVWPGGSLLAQENPHTYVRFECQTCHIPETFHDMRFDHELTAYSLEGQHAGVPCLSCHSVKDFRDVSKKCSACHEDVHQAKMGGDCQKCHAPQGWSRFDTEEIHANSNFPLLGKHLFLDCQSCHKSLPSGDFALQAQRCESCHQQQFINTSSPNHVAFGFSTECQECHQMNQWQPAFMPDHDSIFFPIFSGAHNKQWNDCSTCHVDPASKSVFSCVTCHEHAQPKMDEEHRGIPGYAYNSRNCFDCHPSGEGSAFREHDNQFFPIYSGEHNGKWDNCATCHTDPANRSVFSCLTCHEHNQSKMDDEHRGIAGYAYSSQDCFFCHPSGGKAGFRDHDSQFFPIFSGSHNNTWSECTECHINPTDRAVFSCVNCHEHTQDKMNPKHQGIADYVFASSNCLSCHPQGEQGEFIAHDAQFFPIFSGSHIHTWTACAECHIDPGNRKVFNCVNCHEHTQDKMDPKHQGISGYAFNSANCMLCHPTGEKSEFREHDSQFFPIFSGTHASAWAACAECHLDPNNRKLVSCIDCHEHAQDKTDPFHQGIQGYVFATPNCLQCHPTGEAGEYRDHDAQFFPIYSGSHLSQWNDCTECHTDANNRQQVSCTACHAHTQIQMDPAHSGINGYVFSTPNCLFCHPDGEKGNYTDHDAQFFPIFSGTHISAWSDCVECHLNPDNRKQVSCIDCHEHTQGKTDPAHQGLQDYVFATPNCLQCHPTGEKGEYREHDAQFFPIYSGSHLNEWAVCTECHTDATNRKVVSCIDCHAHTQDKMDPKHQGINGYVFATTNCLFCHPTGEKGNFTEHDSQFFPIFSGSHLNAWSDCAECHTDPNNRKTVSCIDCHEHAQDQTDPVHQGMSGYVFATANCLQCHPTGERGRFTEHDAQFFPIYSGTHNGEWSECAACHTVPGDRKAYSCLTCHEHSQTLMDPAHQGITGYAYASPNCLQCHPSGEKGEFRQHDTAYFPIYSGKHNKKWDSCGTCHNVPGNSKMFTCFACHEHNRTKMDDKHLGEVANYRYDSAACYECHPTGKGD